MTMICLILVIIAISIKLGILFHQVHTNLQRQLKINCELLNLCSANSFLVFEFSNRSHPKKEFNEKDFNDSIALYRANIDPLFNSDFLNTP